MRFSAAPSQARSCASVGGGGEHLGRRAGRVRRAIPQPIGDRGRGGGEPCRLGGPVDLLNVCRLGVIDDGQPPGSDHRRVLDTGDHGDAAQDGARRIAGGGRVLPR